MKKQFTFAAFCGIALATSVAGATDPAEEYKNVLGEGASHATLTVTWGDGHSIDNLASAVKFDGEATVASIIAEALKSDPRFYALQDSEGTIVAYGFDTDGDNSAAVPVDGTALELTDGVATAEADADLTTAAGSALYDHWCVNSNKSVWAVEINGAEASLASAILDGDAVSLVYGSAETGEAFYLRPADQEGVWMAPTVAFDTAVDYTESTSGTKTFKKTVPFIANIIDRSTLYSSYVAFHVYAEDGVTDATTMGVSGNYRYGKDGNNMSATITVTAAGNTVIEPYIQRGSYGNVQETPTDEPTKVTVTVANPVTGIRWEGWPADGVFELLDMVAFRAYVEPDNADFTTINYETSDPKNAVVFVNSRYPVDMLNCFKVGEYTITAKTPDGSISDAKEFTVADRDRTPSDDGYTDGIFWLNEEWYGHANGSINYIKPDGSIMHHAYEMQNPGMGFGATSQYAILYGGKLIVMSKQAKDPGDPRTGGGRLVVIDAYTMKRLASWDELSSTTGGDGRACVGVTPHKVYIGAAGGIGILNLDNLTYTPDAISDMPTGGSSYSKQYGDMVSDGKYVYIVRQSDGLVIIDSENDKYVKTIANTGIQGVTRTADGRIWFVDLKSSKSTLYNVDTETLEVAEQYVLPGTVSCDWGSWRSTKFFAAKRSNKLFWASMVGSSWSPSAAQLYMWDMDADTTPESLTPIIESTDDRWPMHDIYEDKAVKQVPYGSMCFDDRTDKLLWACAMQPKINTDYMYTWYNYTDIESGDIESVRVYPDYFYFPALPMIPDKHLPALVNPDMRVEMAMSAEEPTEIDLYEAIDDMDGANKFINFSLVSEPAATDSEAATNPVSAEILDGKLLLTPQALGETSVKLIAESNGREAEISIPVTVTDSGSSIANTAADMDGKMFDFDGRVLTLSGYEGVTVGIYDINGREAMRITPDSSYYSCALDLPAGVYALSADGGHRFKFMVK